MAVSTFLFFSCKVKYPISESDCINEVKQVNALLSKSDYSNLQVLLSKYETYQKFSVDDVEKKCGKLAEYIKNNGLKGLTYKTKKDSLGVEFSSSNNNIQYLIVGCFNSEKEISSFKYAIAPNEKHFSLTYFNHLLNPKAIPSSPVMPK